jgi:hypothetical protein
MMTITLCLLSVHLVRHDELTKNTHIGHLYGDQTAPGKGVSLDGLKSGAE